MKRLIYLLPVVALVVNSCKKEGCNQPYAFNYDPAGTSESNCVYEPFQFNMAFNLTYGDEVIANGEEFTTVEGRAISIDYYGFYLTEISFLDNGDTVLLEDDAFLVKEGQNVFTTSYIPKGDITGLTFTLGVNSQRNDTLDPTTLDSGIFSPQVPTMYWSWATGYRFLSINGTVDTTNNMSGTSMAAFQYHTGLNQLLRKVVIDQGPNKNSNQISYALNLDLQEVFDGIDFTNEADLVTHTSNNFELAELITNNASNAFKVE